MLFFRADTDSGGPSSSRQFHHTAQSGTREQMEFRLPSAGRLSRLSVACATVSSGGTRQLEIRRNGVATGVVCVIAAGA